MTEDPERLQTALARCQALTALARARRLDADVLRRTVRAALAVLPVTGVAVDLPGPDGQLVRTAAGAPPPAEPAVQLPLLDEDGTALGVLACAPVPAPADLAWLAELAEVLAGLLARDRREQRLRDSERRLAEAQRVSHVGSYDYDVATGVLTCSDELLRLLGTERVPTYQSFLDLLVEEDRAQVRAVHERSLRTGDAFEVEQRVRRADGQVRALTSWGEVVADGDGRPVRIVGTCWDVTDRKELELRLLREALHDRLTGLPNRRLLVDRLAASLAGVPHRSGPVGVLFADVDRFRVINDSLGHDAGDEVLVELGRRFSAVVRPGDTVARFGADSFVLLCEDLSHPLEAVAIADRLQGETHRPISLPGSEVVVTVSTGIALCAEAGASAAELLRDADAAMHRAKSDGRGRSVLFAEEMRTHARGRLDTEVQLRRALAEQHLRLHYQPIVDLRTSAVHGMEALVRWQHPERGLVGPDAFIAVAEETGLVLPLGEWVLEQACAQLAAWRAGYPGLTLAVNLSARQVQSPDLVSRVAAVLDRTGVDPGGLVLEITESVLMRDAQEALGVLASLRALGLHLHVDDFGTGFSSLSYLKRFPVDALKVDRSFVRGLGEEAEDVAIVQAVVALAWSLGMSTVAEGVETQQQADVLSVLGCGSAQGWHYGRPLPPEEATARLGQPALPRARPRPATTAPLPTT